MSISTASKEQLTQFESQLNDQYQHLKGKGLKLDLTRGKPAADQLDLANSLDGILQGNYISDSGIDTRNYGNLSGLPESRALGGQILEVPANNVIAAGNSSLTLMYFAALLEYNYGTQGRASAWRNLPSPKFICPVPGYDRHFSICQNLGIEMVTVPMTENGPDMDTVEQLVAADSSIIGMWCVPKYSNPTGCVYSDDTVRRIANLGKIASPQFRIFWDNAYAIHHLGDNSDQLANLWELSEKAGTLDHLWMFASTSKITFAGAGVSWVAGSTSNTKALLDLLGITVIGFDKVNQLRHHKLFPDMAALMAQMDRHAAILAPKFDLVLQALSEHLTADHGRWSSTKGGYFISFDTQPGLATEVVRLAAEAGVTLTPAGATFPYGKDPQNRNIRLAPSLPPLAELKAAMEVFVCCVKLATVRQALSRC